MNCADELQTLLYVDGELPVHDLPAFEEHLATCAPCRQRAAALRAESALIGDVLHEAEPATAPAPAMGARGLAWAALALAVATAGVHGGLDVLAQLDSQLGWLSPLAEYYPLSLLFGLASLVTQEDVPMLLTSLATLVTVLLALVSFGLVTRRRFVLASALLALLVAAVPAHAVEVRSPARDKSGIVVIPAGETIDDTVIVLGQSIVVEGTVTGDLIAVAQSVRIPGEVRGSLVTLSKSLSVDGVVKGDVYSATQTLDVRGSVERNLLAAAESFDIATGAHIARDAYLAGQHGRVGGAIGRDLHVAGQGLAVSGQVVRGVTFSGNSLDLDATARVGGETTAYVQQAGAVSRASGAQLASEPQIHTRVSQSAGRVGAHARSQWLTLGFYFWQTVRIAAALALGLLLYWLVPALFEWPTPSAGRLLRSAGVGFLVLVATPVAAVLLAITLVGLPVAALAMGTWIGGLYLAGILAALVIGRALLRSPRNGAGAFVLALLVGLVLMRIAVNLPFVGGVLCFVLLVVGLGILVAQLGRLASRLRAPAIS
jgi:anti-sigma factor RsiW